MLRFSTETFRDVTYFDGDGERMLRAMGCSGRVPGALDAADLPDALARLRRAVAMAERPDRGPDEEDGDEEPVVALRHRAQPLLELLEAAVAAGDHVIWERA